MVHLRGTWGNFSQFLPTSQIQYVTWHSLTARCVHPDKPMMFACADCPRRGFCGSTRDSLPPARAPRSARRAVDRLGLEAETKETTGEVVMRKVQERKLVIVMFAPGFANLLPQEGGGNPPICQFMNGFRCLQRVRIPEMGGPRFINQFTVPGLSFCEIAE